MHAGEGSAAGDAAGDAAGGVASGAEGDPAATPRGSTLSADGPRVRFRSEMGGGRLAAAVKVKPTVRATDWEKAKLVQVMDDASGSVAC